MRAPSDLLNAQKDVGVAPQSFKIVITPFFLAHNVDDNDPIIHQHPAAVRFSFHRKGQLIRVCLDRFTHVFRQCFDLAVARSGADDEKVGDRVVSFQTVWA